MRFPKEVAEFYNIEKGGDGATATNTYMVKREKVPSAEWGYPSAGRSGRFLRPYRMRAVQDARSAFPGAVIFAAGGIFDADDAYATLVAGADAIEGYTPYTFYGLGLARKIMREVRGKLWHHGYPTLEAMQIDMRSSNGSVY